MSDNWNLCNNKGRYSVGVQVGCWDGTVLVTRVTGDPGDQGRRLSVVAQILETKGLPVRAVAWPPPESCADSSEGGYCHVFASAGQEGWVRVWDTR